MAEERMEKKNLKEISPSKALNFTDKATEGISETTLVFKKYTPQLINNKSKMIFSSILYSNRAFIH